MPPLRLLISAGEASGEFYGAQLMSALRQREPSLACFGVGGEKMRAAGFESVVDARNVAVVGLGEVVSHLPRIWREFRKLLRAIDARKPDAAVLIDFPDFNLRLARELHQRGVPVIYYVSPQLWAWRPRRIALVRKYVRKMLVIFPFEEKWYRERGIEAEYVGHPLADLPRPQGPFGLLSVRPKQREGSNPPEHVIALLPGSRRQEIDHNLPTMLQAAAQLGGKNAFVIPLPGTVPSRTVSRLTAPSNLWIVQTDDARKALAMSRAAIVASGTATVEAALIGTPFVMVYRVSKLTWLLGRRLVKVPYFAMPNLIAGREVVPELVQSNFTAENVVARLREILDDGPARQKMLEGLAEVRAKLAPPGPGTAAERAADAILRAVGRDAEAKRGLN